jgi:hypothetical protein
MVDHLS